MKSSKTINNRISARKIEGWCETFRIDGPTVIETQLATYIFIETETTYNYRLVLRTKQTHLRQSRVQSRNPFIVPNDCYRYSDENFSACTCMRFI